MMQNTKQPLAVSLKRNTGLNLWSTLLHNLCHRTGICALQSTWRSAVYPRWKPLQLSRIMLDIVAFYRRQCLWSGVCYSLLARPSVPLQAWNNSGTAKEILIEWKLWSLAKICWYVSISVRDNKIMCILNEDICGCLGGP